MKSRKRGEIEVAPVVTSSNKHKLWLIIGIILAAVLVLAIVFFSPAKEALFGKAITLTPQTGINPSIGDTSSGDNTRVATPGELVMTCMNIQLLPQIGAYRNGVMVQSLSEQIQSTEGKRRNVCMSVSGCSFSSLDNNPANDICTGSRQGRCPRVDLYNVAGQVYETGRKNLCENAGCIFSDGGLMINGVKAVDISPTGDTCVPRPVATPEIGNLCFNHADDDFDRSIDGQDSDCKLQQCSNTNSTQVWTWSYLPADDPDVTPDRVGCCAVNQCQSGRNGCVNYDTNPNPTSICGSGNNLDICGTGTDDFIGDGSTSLSTVKHAGELSDGGAGYCTGSVWQICTAATEGTTQGNFVCHSSRWVAAEICTDGIDNDLNGKADCADEVCGANAACGAPVSSCLPNGDVIDDNMLDSNDVFALTFVLIAVEDSSCGGASQSSCEVDSGFYACDNGVISETSIASCS